jgi:hypothetical protein
MDKEGIKKHKTVFDAWLDGAEVEVKYCDEAGWLPCDEPMFLSDYDYRVRVIPNSSFETMGPGYHWVKLKNLVPEHVTLIWMWRDSVFKVGDDKEISIDEAQDIYSYLGPVEPYKGDK